MQTYRIKNACSGSISLPGYGIVPFDYKSGLVTPQDAAESDVLEHLTRIGYASPAEPAKSGKAPKFAADEDAAPSPVEE